MKRLSIGINNGSVQKINEESIELTFNDADHAEKKHIHKMRLNKELHKLEFMNRCVGETSSGYSKNTNTVLLMNPWFMGSIAENIYSNYSTKPNCEDMMVPQFELRKFWNSEQDNIIEEINEHVIKTKTRKSVYDAAIETSALVHILCIYDGLFFENLGIHINGKSSKDVVAVFLLEVYTDYPLSSPQCACIFWNLPNSTSLDFSDIPAHTFTKHVLLRDSWTPHLCIGDLITKLDAAVKQTIQNDFQTPSSKSSVPKFEALSGESETLTSKYFSLLPDSAPSTKAKSLNTVEQLYNCVAEFPSTSLIIVYIISILTRIVIGVAPHTGRHQHPGYSDFEVHRHWMEITSNVPVHEWYVNTPKNDRSYWPLDFPPLIAYAHWLMSYVAYLVEPKSIVLFESWGYETLRHRIFMRFTVIFWDLLLTFPVATYYWLYVERSLSSYQKKLICLLLLLNNPISILIDHIHFHYDSCSLSIVLLCICFLAKKRYSLAAISFVVAVMTKQTFLYFLPSFLVSILACNMYRYTYTGFLRKTVNYDKVFVIGYRMLKYAAVAAATFVIILLPILLSYLLSDATQDRSLKGVYINSIVPVYKGVFPLSRGLTESPVSNWWRVLNPLCKFKQLSLTDYRSSIVNLCWFLSTIGGFAGLKAVLRKPSIERICLSFGICSLSFYMFGYLVHEKVVIMPTTLFLLILPHIGSSLGAFTYCSTYSMIELLTPNIPAIAPPLRSVYAIKGYFIVTYTIIWNLCLFASIPFVTMKTSNDPRQSIQREMPISMYVNSCVRYPLFPRRPFLSFYNKIKGYITGNEQEESPSGVHATGLSFKERMHRRHIHMHRWLWIIAFTTIGICGFRAARTFIPPPASKPWLFDYLDNAFLFPFFLAFLILCQQNISDIYINESKLSSIFGRFTHISHVKKER